MQPINLAPSLGGLLSNQRHQFEPGHHQVHLVQEFALARAFGLAFEPALGQAHLCHAVKVSHRASSVEVLQTLPIICEATTVQKRFRQIQATHLFQYQSCDFSDLSTMSAIAGILYFNNTPVGHGLIELLTGAMKSRGPDEQQHWSRGSVALGHCMLRTTVESIEEHQPIRCDDENIVMVWDGRLDNREEIQRELTKAGIILRNNSDGELAFKAYFQWGSDCPNHLLGDFAFAVWDSRQNIIFCARDHLGARPFYFAHNKEFFAFASEEEALLILPEISSKPNEERIAYFLLPTFRDFDYSHSWLEDVWSLMPANTLTVSITGTKKKREYWRLELHEPYRYSSDEECQESFLQIFGEAVRCRLRSSGDVAAMISGGMDSASLAAMTKRLLPTMPGKLLHTYSVVSDDTATCIESQCIRSLTSSLNKNAHSVSVPLLTGMITLEDVLETAWKKPHPVDNSILLPALMCLASSRNGHRVLLHGVSGDLTTLTPMRYMAHYAREGKWQLTWRECQKASRNHTYLRQESAFLLFLNAIAVAHLPIRLRSLVRSFREKVSGGFLTQSPIDSSFSKRLNLSFRLGSLKNMQLHGWEAKDIKQWLRDTLEVPGILRGLEGYDRVAGHYGIELRDPWADKRLVEFFFHLPMHLKAKDGWTKYLVRSSFLSDLEPFVTERLGKEHLGWHFVEHSVAKNKINRNSSWKICEKYVDKAKLKDLINPSKREINIEHRDLIYNIDVLSRWLERIEK